MIYSLQAVLSYNPLSLPWTNVELTISLPHLKPYLTPVVVRVNTNSSPRLTVISVCPCLPHKPPFSYSDVRDFLDVCQTTRLLLVWHLCTCNGFCFARSSQRWLPGWLLGISLHFVCLFVVCLPLPTSINSMRIGTMSLLPVMIFPLPGAVLGT